MINPYENRDKINRNISLAEWGSRMTATVTTSIGAFIWAHDLGTRYMPTDWTISPYVAALVGILGAVVMGFLTDFMFGNLLQRVTTDTLMARHPNVRKFNGAKYFTRLRTAESVIFGLLLFGLLWFDMYTTFIIKDPIADQARTESTADVAAVTAGISTAQIKAAAPMQAQMKDLQNRISAEERRVATANPSLTKLAAEGNAWARQTIEKNKQRATAKIRTELDNITATYNRTLDSQSAALTATQAQTNEQNARIAAANQRNRTVMAGMYIAFSVGPKALSIILRILMVITFLAYSTNFHPDLTGDGIIDYADVEAYFQRQQEEYRRRSQAGAAAAHPPAHGGGSTSAGFP